MISKNHRQNSNFQIVHFLAGSCHTPDGAYALLLDLKEERQAAVDNYQVTMLRNKAKRLNCDKQLKSDDEVARINAEADLLELNQAEASSKMLYDAAVSELNFIGHCIKSLEGKRKYAQLSDDEACQAMQREEWKLELIERAKMQLASCGIIPADQLTAMTQHPDFAHEILPAIEDMCGHKMPQLLPNTTSTHRLRIGDS